MAGLAEIARASGGTSFALYLGMEGIEMIKDLEWFLKRIGPDKIAKAIRDADVSNYNLYVILRRLGIKGVLKEAEALNVEDLAGAYQIALALKHLTNEEAMWIIRRMGLVSFAILARNSGEKMDRTLAALRKLDRFNLLDEFTLPALMEIADESGKDTDRAYQALADMGEKGTFRKVGILAVSEMVRAARAGSEEVRLAIAKLDYNFLSDKIGAANLVIIATAAGENAHAALHALLKLEKKGLIEKYGLNNLVELAKAAGEHAHLLFIALARGGAIEERCGTADESSDKETRKRDEISWGVFDAENRLFNDPIMVRRPRSREIGGGEDENVPLKTCREFDGERILAEINISDLAAITKTAGEEVELVYIVLDEMIEKGTVKSQGIEKVKELFFKISELMEKKNAKVKEKVYLKLKNLVRIGVVDAMGLPALIGMTFVSSPEIAAAYAALEELGRGGLIKKYGVDNLMELSRAAWTRMGDASLALVELDRAGGVEKLGMESLIRVARAAGAGAGFAFAALRVSLEKKVFEKYGQDKMKEMFIRFAEAARGEEKHFLLVKRMMEKDQFEKYGVDRIGDFIKKIAEAAGGAADSVYDLAGYLVDKDLLEKYGMDRIESFLVEFSKAAKDNLPPACMEMQKIFEKGQVEIIGLDVLKEIALAAGEGTSRAFFALTDKISTANLVAIARAAGKDTGEAFSAIEELYKQGLIDEIGVPALIKLAEAAKEKTNAAFLLLVRLKEKGLLKDKDGVEKAVDFVIDVTRASGKSAYSAYEAVGNLMEKGWLEKIGYGGLLQIAWAAQEGTGAMYAVLQKMIETDDDRRDVPKIKLGKKYGLEFSHKLVLEVAKAATGGVSEAAIELEALIGDDLIYTIGADYLTELARLSEGNTGKTFSALRRLAKKRATVSVSYPVLKEIAYATRKDTGAAFALVEKSYDKRAIYSFGPDFFKYFMLEITRHAGIGTSLAYEALGKLVENGLVERTGLQFLIDIAAFAGVDSGSVFSALALLEDKKLVDRIGQNYLLDMAREAKGSAGMIYAAFAQMKIEGLKDEELFVRNLSFYEIPFPEIEVAAQKIVNKDKEKVDSVPQTVKLSGARIRNAALLGLLLTFDTTFDGGISYSLGKLKVYAGEKDSITVGFNTGGSHSIFVSCFSNEGRLPEEVKIEIIAAGDSRLTLKKFKVQALVFDPLVPVRR
jgi:Fe2+ or Zn2+ uptake regulation protein